MESSSLESDKRTALEFACCVACDAYEMQGFINGFRIGMALAADLESGKAAGLAAETEAAG